MMTLASKIKDLPLMSLQTGELVGHVDRPLINPANLEVLAFWCRPLSSRYPKILMLQDVRQIAGDCLVIDSDDELTDPNDVIRLAHIAHVDFKPKGKPVVSDTGRRLGLVNDYAITFEANRVQKLYIRPPMLRSLLEPDLIIDRQQIIDVTPKHILVRDSLVKAPAVPSESLPQAPI